MEENFVKPNCPISRLGQPIEMAHAISFLANNEESSYITGQNIVADGGFSISMPKPPNALADNIGKK
jgi:NAD(P)-dependent dehydrogenase (short-subunit alcohol dehydrogenase family)